MNFNEWYKLKKTNKSLLNWDYYNKVHKLLKEYNYINDTNKCVIHHLRDTEEQRNYNDNHYELWGFEIDENGNEHFEYGKYVIFVTKEEHTEIHKCSDETRLKISQVLTGRFISDETRNRLSESHLGIKCSESTKELFRKMYKGRRLCPEFSDETRKKISAANKGKTRSEEFKHHLSVINSGSGNPMYGKPPANKGKPISDKHKKRISDANKGNQAFLGKNHSEESKLKISNANKGNNNGMFGSGEQYKKFKTLFPDITWHSFLKVRKSNYFLLKAIIFIYFKCI